MPRAGRTQCGLPSPCAGGTPAPPPRNLVDRWGEFLKPRGGTGRTGRWPRGRSVGSGISSQPMPNRSPLRVVVADDSAVFRTLLRRILGRLPDVELVGSAADGRQAVEMVERLRPDVLLVDVHMPVMNGPQAVLEMGRRGLDVAVVVVSATDLHLGDRTVQFLREGALDFILKPQGGAHALDELQRHLVRSLEICRASRPVAARAAPGLSQRPPASVPARAGRRPGPFKLVVLAVSTGGPAALGKVLPRLDPRFPLPLLVVQHMPAYFTGHLARSLDRECALDVAEARDGEPLAPGRIRLAPGDWHLRLRRQGRRALCVLDQSEPVNSCRPAADPLFQSAAELLGPRVLSVVMTGMGSDGLAGVRAVRAGGGYCLTQDAASCAVYGMPRAVAEAGESDEVVELDRLAERLTALVGEPGLRRTA